MSMNYEKRSRNKCFLDGGKDQNVGLENSSITTLMLIPSILLWTLKNFSLDSFLEGNLLSL
ncbi:hypothetical protein ACRRTK_001038 [Alexandromys fortis]